MSLTTKCDSELAKETIEYLQAMKTKVERCALQASSLHNECGFFHEISSALDNAERALQAFRGKRC